MGGEDSGCDVAGCDVAGADVADEVGSLAVFDLCGLGVLDVPVGVGTEDDVPVLAVGEVSGSGAEAAAEAVGSWVAGEAPSEVRNAPPVISPATAATPSVRAATRGETRPTCTPPCCPS